jgi:8-oxo-dGTP pyrophosphatase MutT (NUDIX family)
MFGVCGRLFFRLLRREVASLVELDDGSVWVANKQGSQTAEFERTGDLGVLLPEERAKGVDRKYTDPVNLRADDSLHARISANLAAHERSIEPDPSLRPAAVAMTIVADRAGEACFVITRRVTSLRTHSGQWALPGGRIDEGEDPAGAALRELDEEVGLSCPSDRVLGLLDDYPTRSGFRITPVVVWAGNDVVLTPNPDEVAEVHRVPIGGLDAPGIPKLSDLEESDRPVLSVRILGQDIFAPTAAVIFQFREVAIHGRPTRVSHYDQPFFAWR